MVSAPTSVELSPAPTLVFETSSQEKEAVVEPQSLASTAPLRKYLLLAFFCLGQFLDTLNNSAVLPALPAITHNVGLTESDSVWLLAAYQATFASFLLIVSSAHFIYQAETYIWFSERSNFGCIQPKTCFYRWHSILRCHLSWRRFCQRSHRVDRASSFPRHRSLPYNPIGPQPSCSNVP
jgi:hypothetical protein